VLKIVLEQSGSSSTSLALLIVGAETAKESVTYFGKITSIALDQHLNLFFFFFFFFNVDILTAICTREEHLYIRSLVSLGLLLHPQLQQACFRATGSFCILSFLLVESITALVQGIDLSLASLFFV
jgi:hypothetical protein